MVDAYEFPSDVFIIDADTSISFTYDGDESGLISIALDYFILDQGTEDTKLSLTINNDYQFYEIFVGY
jgi:hypothetical protein